MIKFRQNCTLSDTCLPFTAYVISVGIFFLCSFTPDILDLALIILLSEYVNHVASPNLIFKGHRKVTILHTHRHDKEGY